MILEVPSHWIENLHWYYFVGESEISPLSNSIFVNDNHLICIAILICQFVGTGIIYTWDSFVSLLA